MTPATGDVEGLLRELAPQALGAVVRRYGHFEAAEDAVQEAMIAATEQWPGGGLPDDPKAWLIRVTERRLIDALRAERAQRRREDTVASWRLPEDWLAPGADRPPDGDDTLILLFMCCHPALAPDLRIALTLRSVGGLTTAEIARAFLVPESTMAQRISRGKRRIRASGVPFRLPAPAERSERLAAVLHVLYLIFNEGYKSSSGPYLVRVELAMEAIRLARLLHRLLPKDPEVTGLLALMLLTDARRPARTGADGALIPLAEQDRTLWNAAYVAEGVRLISDALPRGEAGPYQVQAAIAAVHDEAASAEDTDWPQIVALYEVLLRFGDNPMTALNHAVAVAMARGPRAGLELLDGLAGDPRVADHHRLHAARAHLLELEGDAAGARAAYVAAAERAGSVPERRYLSGRAARLR
ncbi:MAG: sigma-70 family RNA polymerase sigma factor [Streptosporangiales bacterium]|nr:sigma-70 family RNA polymerase sigma factor [Streptosporangiales bacterium]